MIPPPVVRALEEMVDLVPALKKAWVTFYVERGGGWTLTSVGHTRESLSR